MFVRARVSFFFVLLFLCFSDRLSECHPACLSTFLFACVYTLCVCASANTAFIFELLKSICVFVSSHRVSIRQPVCLSVYLSTCLCIAFMYFPYGVQDVPLLEGRNISDIRYVCKSCNCLFVCLSVCLPVCLSACLPVCVFFCLSICLPVCLSVCLSVSLSVYPKVCLSVYILVNLSMSLYVCLSILTV